MAEDHHHTHKFIAREKGQNIGSEALSGVRRHGHVYRGMTHDEYHATLGAGKGIKSRNDHSLKGEGTNFAEDPESAESYVNYGRDDPRKSGKPNYLVEARADGMARKSDGYYHTHNEVSPTRVWAMHPENDAVVAHPQPIAPAPAAAPPSPALPLASGGAADKARRKALLTVKRIGRDTGGDARLKGAIDNFGQQRQQRFNQPANGSQSAALGLDTNYANPPQLLVADPPQQQRSGNQGMAAQTADLGSAVDDGIGMLTGRSDAKPTPAKGAPAAAPSSSVPSRVGSAAPTQNDGTALSALKQGISGEESGGKYGILGPVQKSGDYAVGKYQIMASNVPSWTKQALGRSMTPDEFRADPQAQEDVTSHILGGYLDQYGPKGAAAMWFSGKPDINSSAKDSLGTSVPGYVANATRPQPASTGPVSSADIPQDDNVPQAKRGGFMRKHFDDGGSSGDGGDGGDGNGGDGDSSGDSAGDSAATAAGNAAGFGGVGDASGAPAGTSTDSGVTGFGGVGDDSATNGVNGSVGIGSPNGAPNGVSVGYGNTGNNGTGNAAGVGTGAGGVGSGAAGAGGGTSGGATGGGATGGGAGTASGGSGVNDTLNAYLQMRGLGDYGVASLGVPPGLLSGVSTAVSPVSTAGISAPTYNAAVISAVNAQMNGQSPYGTPAYNAAVNALKGVNGNTGFGGGSATAQGPGTTGFNSTPTGAEGVSTAGLGQSAGPSAATSAPAAPNNPYSSPAYAAAVAALKSGAGAPGPGASATSAPSATQVAGLGTPAPAQQQEQQGPPPGQTSAPAPATNGNNGNSSIGGRYGYSAPVSAQRNHGGTVVKRAEGGIAKMPTNEMVARAMQIIARHKAATGGKQTTATTAPAAASTSPASAAPAAYTGPGAGGLSYSDLPAGSVGVGGNVWNPSTGSLLINNNFLNEVGSWPGNGGAASAPPTTAAPAATPAPITPALDGQNIGNASGATGAPLGITPMASPTGGQGMPGSPSAASGTPTYNNTLNEALGTNSPTSNQVFGFNYPVPPPSQPQPQGPVSQAQINAEYGVGDGSQIGTGVFAAGGAIIMDALTRANSRARKAKGKR